MSRVTGIVNEFLKSLQKPLPELEKVCRDLNLRCGNEETRDSFIREMIESLGKYDEKIVQRDESIILAGMEILPGLSLAEYWSELSVKTQDAIWKYINLILLAGAKHVRYLDRKTKTDDLSISDKFKDPEIREKMMDTIRKTLETIPQTSETNPETDEEIGNFMNQLNDTSIGSLIRDIVSDLSGDISPEKLGLPEDMSLESMGPDDLMGLLGNPAVSSNLFSLVSKISNKITGKMKDGSFNQEDLVRESQELLTKSGGLLQKMNPEVAQMMKSMGLNPDDLKNISSRKMRRMVEKKAKGKGKGKGKVVRKKKDA